MYVEEQKYTPEAAGQKRKNVRANLKIEYAEKQRIKNKKIKYWFRSAIESDHGRIDQLDTLKRQTNN